MNVFVAGGSGAIGIPLVRALITAGYQVTALTRSGAKQDQLRALGASVVIADALNREVLIAAVEAAYPTHVIHQLTALPKGGARRPTDLAATNRLRIDGTRNLLKRRSARVPSDLSSARLPSFHLETRSTRRHRIRPPQPSDQWKTKSSKPRSDVPLKASSALWDVLRFRSSVNRHHD